MAEGTCNGKTCDEPAHCLGFCKGHYERLRRHGDIDEATPLRKRGVKRLCSLSTCDEPHYGKDYCRPHYQRVREHGDPLEHIPLAATKNRPRPCNHADCTDPHYIGGYCIRHHYKVQRYGSADGGSYQFSELARDRSLPREERFWARVNRNGPVPAVRPDLGPCWLWRLSTHDAGYGQTFLFPEIGIGTHRVAWVLSGCEPLLPGHELDHLCRIPLCCRPSHLEQVPKAVNIMRGNSVPARNGRKSHCSQGHEFTADNTKLDARGHRRCRRCANDKVLRLAALRALTKTERAISAAYRLAIAADRCRYCTSPGKETDHYFPLIKGGTEQWFNLTRACVHCNRSKATRCGTWFLLRRQPAAALAQAA